MNVYNDPCQNLSLTKSGKRNCQIEKQRCSLNKILWIPSIYGIWNFKQIPGDLSVVLTGNDKLKNGKLNPPVLLLALPKALNCKTNIIIYIYSTSELFMTSSAQSHVRISFPPQQSSPWRSKAHHFFYFHSVDSMHFAGQNIILLLVFFFIVLQNWCKQTAES